MSRLLEITVQPGPNVSHFDTTVILDRKRYTFAFFTNAVDRGWFMSIENDDASAVVNGIALAAGVDLLHPYRYLALPPGSLWIHDKGLEGADPDLEDFVEKRCSLFYLEEAA